MLSAWEPTWRPVCPGTDDRAGVRGRRPLPGTPPHHRPRCLGPQAGALSGQERPAVLQPEPRAKLGRTSTLSLQLQADSTQRTIPLSHRRGDQGPERSASLAGLGSGHQGSTGHQPGACWLLCLAMVADLSLPSWETGGPWVWPGLGLECSGLGRALPSLLGLQEPAE